MPWQVIGRAFYLCVFILQMIKIKETANRLERQWVSQSLTKMNKLLQRYRDKRPEIVFEWHDEPTGAEGWVVINSLRNGAAGGGTRMRKGLTKMR